jgi:dihydrofolate synthase/folylpolyglutamate synthase
MAFVVFRRAGVEVAVVEVGLGGRLDATNVVAPLASVIVSIALDHQEHLGATIGAIAREKAGIIKTNTPVVIGPVPTEARREIGAVARARQAPLIEAFDGVEVAALGPAHAGGQWIRLRTPAHDYGEVALSLAGAHQIGNAVVAVRTLEALADRGVVVSAEAAARGLAHTEWPGRLDTRRLPAGRTVVLDAAHNPAGAETLAAALAALSGEPWPIVFSASREKDARGMLAALLPRARALVVTRASNRRAADPETLAAIARAIAPGVPVLVAPEPADALETAWRIAPAIVVAGSMFLLGDVIPLLS